MSHKQMPSKLLFGANEVPAELTALDKFDHLNNVLTGQTAFKTLMFQSRPFLHHKCPARYAHV